ncbi:ATP-binding protein [Kineosporia babensis]|uniref:ATP-binding protein n=1 Tax=Kineosporia babensis TaxID=499548 RepID=A0A9X1STF8_9ACTN|nr:ATP-binding protein [Kineosporia babensis]MCD5311246.1 ATP-binding protein [Kineosporia babensis]
MLFGRASGLKVIDRVLGRARFGCASTLVIRGEAGIGKSALLAYAQTRAADLTVLSARGQEAASTAPFAGLAQLFRPVHPQIQQLPGPQAQALNAALGSGPPAAPGEPVHVDRFSLCAATLSLLRALAAENPLLVVIDDLQWLDPSSREAVLFAARRITDQGVGLLLAVRTGFGPAEVLTRQCAGLPELALTGLGAEGSRQLCQALAPGLSKEQADQIHADSAGNPLGIQELCASPGRLPGQTLTQIMAGRLAELPARTRKALLLIAAAGHGRNLDLVRRALPVMNLGLADLAPAEAGGLLVVEGASVELQHPLMRSALNTNAARSELVEVHAALAEALNHWPGAAAADARAWHLAQAVPAPCPQVGELLAQTAARARSRGGNAEAARAFEKAAHFGEPADRPARLVRAARCWQLAGRTGKMIPLLDEALERTDDPHLRALIRHMRGYVRMWRALPRDGMNEMIRGAHEVQQADPARAALMFADAAIAHFMLGEPAELLAATRRSFELSRDTQGPAALVAAVAHSAGLVINGHRAEGQKLLSQVVPALLSQPPLPRVQEYAHAACVAIWLEDYPLADRLLQAVITEARAHGALGVLPQTLAIASELEFRLGHWQRSLACAAESVELAEETRQASVYGRYFAARVHAGQGRSEVAVKMLARTGEVTARCQAPGLDLQITHTRALLAFGRGDLKEAIALLEAAAQLPGTREQSIVPWAFDLVEAYAGAGRRSEAQQLLDDIAVDEPAPGCRADLLIARTLRCRALLAHEPEAVFARALQVHDRLPMPFERARTLLSLGRSLPRGPQARAVLAQALYIFEDLGAAHWAEQTRTELAGPTGPLTGGTSRELLGATRTRTRPARTATRQQLILKITATRAFPPAKSRCR